MSTEQKVKQTIHNTSRTITKEIGEKLGIEFEQNALDLIAELTYRRLAIYGSDLDAFQKHAKRSTITAEDVKLLVRRNDSLREHIENKIHTINSLKQVKQGVGRKEKENEKK